jgi:hypothetical protein
LCSILIGAGCPRALVFSWGGNPGVGSLHRFRDAVERGWPHPLELEPRPDAVVLPAWAVNCVAPAPGGAKPSYALGYYDRDNDAYRAWDAIGRDREAFGRWLEDEIFAGAAA